MTTSLQGQTQSGSSNETYYAWSNFEVLDKDDPHNPVKIKKIAPGAKVTAEKLGVSDEEFKEFIKLKAVRTVKHPDMGKFNGSPIELKKAEIAAMASDEGYFDTQHGRVGTDKAPEVDPETGQPIPKTN